MKDIVTNSGLSKGAFYHYFSSKEKVFEEVIEFFFSELLTMDYSKLPQHSLKEFYTAYLDDMRNKTEKPLNLGNEESESFNTNHYYLIFDAVKMLPDFKTRFLNYHQNELKNWELVIANARNNNEIKTPLTNSQLARLFVYSGDGLGIHLIITNTKDQFTELKELFDSLWVMVKI